MAWYDINLAIEGTERRHNKSYEEKPKEKKKGKKEQRKVG